MRVFLILLFIFLSFETICFAELPSVGQIERAQEILQENEVLRSRIENGEKAYIKNIIVKGITLLDENKVKEIIFPFQKQWLNKTDIQQILGAIGQAYKQKGYLGLSVKSSFQVINNCLEIEINEKLMKNDLLI